MSGGPRGPVPKRASQRRRRNKPNEAEVTKGPASSEVPDAPPADEDWHPVARRWYESLQRSGQRYWYEPSDWATAYLLAESLSRDLNPQVVGITEQGDVVRATIPLKGTSLSAYLKGMGVLLTTEGDRRRVRIELEKQQARDPDEEAAVTKIDEYRRRLEGGRSG